MKRPVPAHLLGPEKFTDEDMKALMNLRNRGFAVCVFTPGELQSGKCSRRVMEDFLAQEGNELLAMEREEEEQEEGE
jgi:hypothetical protein